MQIQLAVTASETNPKATATHQTEQKRAVNRENAQYLQMP